MRNHIFEPARAIGQYNADLEYIQDYGPIFKTICEIDACTERAMLAGAVSGYTEDECGQVLVNGTESSMDSCMSVPNKGWVGMWEENGVIFGLYRHDFHVYLMSVRAEDLAVALWDRKMRAGTEFGSERLRKALRTFGRYYEWTGEHEESDEMKS